MNRAAFLPTRTIRGLAVYGFALSLALLLGVTLVLRVWVAVGVAALLAASFLVVRWPVTVFLGLYAFLAPFDPVSLVGDAESGVTLTRIFGLLAGVSLLGMGVIRGRITWPSTASLWWAAYVLWALASIMWAVDQEVSFARLPTALSLFLLYLIVSSVRMHDDEFGYVVGCVILGGVAAASYAGFLYFQGDLELVSFGRATLWAGGHQANPNKLASALLLPFSLSLSLFLESQKISRRFFSLCAMGIISGGVLLTMSRGGVVALGVVILFCLRHFWKRRRFWIAATVLGAVTVFMPELFFARFRGLLEQAYLVREEIYRQGLEALARHWVWGMGLENSPIFVPTRLGVITDPHNMYLASWLQTGIVGFFLFLMALACHFRQVSSWQGGRRAPSFRMMGLKAACAGMIVAGMFVQLNWQKDFWLLWMLIVMATHVHRRTAETVGT